MLEMWLPAAVLGNVFALYWLARAARMYAPDLRVWTVLRWQPAETESKSDGPRAPMPGQLGPAAYAPTADSDDLIEPGALQQLRDAGRKLRPVRRQQRMRAHRFGRCLWVSACYAPLQGATHKPSFSP